MGDFAEARGQLRSDIQRWLTELRDSEVRASIRVGNATRASNQTEWLLRTVLKRSGERSDAGKAILGKHVRSKPLDKLTMGESLEILVEMNAARALRPRLTKGELKMLNPLAKERAEIIHHGVADPRKVADFLDRCSFFCDLPLVRELSVGEMLVLATPGTGPDVVGRAAPKDLYWVVEGRLLGMKHPAGLQRDQWEEIHDSGIEGLVCLTGEPSYDPAPLHIAHATALEDLAHGGPPTDPTNEQRLIEGAATVVRTYLANEVGIAVHCAGGTGRTGTVIGLALTELGLAANDVQRHLDRIHKARGRKGWPESEWQSAILRKR